jgi:uncharacterized circularly permuted ATP-grasp superfamily protein/uncharacterized alpha-E superfamily protein
MPNLEPSAISRPDLGYDNPSDAWDEMVSAEGQVRPHWREFVGQIDALGLDELRRRWEEAKQLIRQNGVTYNVYADPQGMDRPWELDPLPLLIAPQDARTVETGLVQRAMLLDRILADLYGPQTLLSSGVLPPELVFGHPAFYRPCHGVKVPRDRYLHFYAADIGRTQDGSFFVLTDRTQAPSGAGYALENRIVLSRMLPDVFQDCRVFRLAPFFRTLRETLRSLAPPARENPRVVLLTPGPYNETYFEHAYLARYLGYTLVEGSDLTVRENRLFLKLLGGLEQVDVILRRLDDDYCDPLELRRDSFLGVPGLVQAVRAGNVAVANTLGSGLIESPALLAYLPVLCARVLGEDLRLPSVPTWWCGDPDSLAHVLANLSRMVIKPAFGPRRFDPIFGEELSREECVALSDRIAARPTEYVGQEQLELSTTPVLLPEGLRPRHLVVRSFLVASGTGYELMPGGLTRIAASADTLVVSMQKGGGSKDTWVLSESPVSTFSLLPPSAERVELTRDGGDLPSRAADDLFWLGRYVERVEGAVRLSRGIVSRLTERSGLADVPELPSLLRALTAQTVTYPGFIGQGADARLDAPEAELLSVLGDPQRPGSLAATTQALHRIAGRVRDRLSIDMWRILSNLDDLVEDPRAHDEDLSPGIARRPARDRDTPRRLGAAGFVLDRKVIDLAAFGGLVADSMTRGQGWRFLEMGRRLERALHVISLLRTTLIVATVPESPLLEAILEISDSSMTYRRRYMAQLHTAPVLDLILADADNPRSLVSQLASLADHVDRLPRNEYTAGWAEERQILLGALNRTRTAGVATLALVDSMGRRPELETLLAGLVANIPFVSDSLTRTYFTHLQPARQYGRSVFDS